MDNPENFGDTIHNEACLETVQNNLITSESLIDDFGWKIEQLS